MAGDIPLRWELLTPHGIRINEAEDAWWSGHVSDLLELDQGQSGLLVATETGGVWTIAPNGTTMPLSDSWDWPDVNCLAAGPGGPRHFFAGCRGRNDDGRKFNGRTRDDGVIYETDPTSTAPLLTWTPVAAPLPAGAGKVNDLVVLTQNWRIVAACDGGLYWSDIPLFTPGHSLLDDFVPVWARRRASYAWQRAQEVAVGQSGYFSLVLGALDDQPHAGDDLGYMTLVAGGNSGGVFVALWQNPHTLVVKQPHLVDADNLDAAGAFWNASSTGATSVAACADFPNVVYAASSIKNDGRLKLIARTDDGGMKWTLTNSIVKDSIPFTLVQSAAGDQGDGWNNCLAVMPFDPEVVALGWQAGTFVSTDGAASWTGTSGGAHLHADVHVLSFRRPANGERRTLYIGSDGGLAKLDLDAFLAGLPLAESSYNRLMPTLQCYATVTPTGANREFYGTLGVSHAAPTAGWVSTGVQDNGNVYCAAGGPWQQVGDGDGGWNAFLEDGGLAHNINGEYAHAAAVPPLNPLVLTDTGLIPISGALVPFSPVNSPLGDAVRRPSFRSTGDQLLLAVAGQGSTVYGLFGGQAYTWQPLGELPQGLIVQGVTSHTGATVLVGTTGGRIFALDSAQGSVQELPIKLPKPKPSTPQLGGLVHRIVTLSETSAFALLSGTNLGNSYVLRLDGLSWNVPTSAGLPADQYLYGIECAFQLDRTLVFVSTDTGVYSSDDAGEQWVYTSAGLPRRPHGADLRLRVGEDKSWLHLSTFGRSVWRAELEGLYFG